MDVLWPRRWHVVEILDDGRISICSSHRTRAAAVLDIPVSPARDYHVMSPTRIRLMNALAASSSSTTMKEDS